MSLTSRCVAHPSTPAQAVPPVALVVDTYVILWKQNASNQKTVLWLLVMAFCGENTSVPARCDCALSVTSGKSTDLLADGITHLARRRRATQVWRADLAFRQHRLYRAHEQESRILLAEEFQHELT